MKTIRAAVCNAFAKPLEIAEISLAPPDVGEVQVTMEACAICHSDIAFADGLWGGTLPAVYGHEGVGRITALGQGVTRFSEGERVLVTLLRSCGGCAPCAKGAPALCGEKPGQEDGPLRQSDGGAIVQGMDCGAFAEACTVHESQLITIPEDIPAEEACLLSCGVITGIGAVVNTANVRPGQTVVVVGAGGVGLNAIQGARLAGAGRIVAIDLNEEKLALAKSFGATDGILATDAEPWEQLRKIAPAMADALFITVGAISAFESAPMYLGSLGKAYLVGMPKVGATAEYEPVNIAAAGQGLIGSKMGDVVLARDIPWMLDLVGQGRLELSSLVSKCWPLDQINEALDDTRSGTPGRNVILF